MSSDVQQAGSGLGSPKPDASHGTGSYCDNVCTVDDDLYALSDDLNTLTNDLSTAKQDIQTVNNDAANLSASGHSRRHPACGSSRRFRGLTWGRYRATGGPA